MKINAVGFYFTVIITMGFGLAPLFFLCAFGLVEVKP